MTFKYLSVFGSSRPLTNNFGSGGAALVNFDSNILSGIVDYLLSPKFFAGFFVVLLRLVDTALFLIT
jgi:hypothetical protein